MSSGSPTFLAKNGHSCIDLVIVSNNVCNIMTDCFTDEEAHLYSGAPVRGHVPLLCSLRFTPVGQRKIFTDT